tara:strand:+ start:141 stop:536 length:396 start_codon:yes stop_codon:yes gene_type:complete
MNIQVQQDTNCMVNYIQNNIKLIKNTSSLINFIKNNDINYSENINGLFINLSLLNETKIKIFYDLVYYLSNNEINIEGVIEDIIEDTIEDKIENITEDNFKQNIIDTKDCSNKYKKLKLSQFQSKLLMYSK